MQRKARKNHPSTVTGSHYPNLGSKLTAAAAATILKSKKASARRNVGSAALDWIAYYFPNSEEIYTY